ncbi:MAG: hypothetical protein ACRDZP_02970 [Acidimicrobiales bacterium]
MADIAAHVDPIGPEVNERLHGIEAAVGRIERLQANTSDRLEALERAMSDCVDAMRELRQTIDALADSGNEGTELLGRLLRAATARLDALEAAPARLEK